VISNVGDSVTIVMSAITSPDHLVFSKTIHSKPEVIMNNKRQEL
jgi:hypothetical protein